MGAYRAADPAGQARRRVLGVSCALSEAEVHWRKSDQPRYARCPFVVSDDHGACARRASGAHRRHLATLPVPSGTNAIHHAPTLAIRKRIGAELRQVWNAPGGGKRRVAIRAVINGVMYILSTGCQGRALPKDVPPRSTVHDYLGLWNWDGTLDRIHHALYLKCREKAAREASPTACIIDSQSVKSAEKGGLASTATASMPAS